MHGMMTMSIAMIIGLLSGAMVIKNAKPKKPQYKKSSYTLLGIHQDGGIFVFLKTRKERQKNCGYKHGHFFVW